MCVMMLHKKYRESITREGIHSTTYTLYYVLCLEGGVLCWTPDLQNNTRFSSRDLVVWVFGSNIYDGRATNDASHVSIELSGVLSTDIRNSVVNTPARIWTLNSLLLINTSQQKYFQKDGDSSSHFSVYLKTLAVPEPMVQYSYSWTTHTLTRKLDNTYSQWHCLYIVDTVCSECKLCYPFLFVCVRDSGSVGEKFCEQMHFY